MTLQTAGEEKLSHGPTLLYPNLQKHFSWSRVMLSRSPSSRILPDMVHAQHVQDVQHVHVGPAVSPVMFLLSVCVCLRVHSIKTTVAHRSDILGAVMACWMVFVLGICNLYMSYSNLNFYKSWMQINNPEMISWIRYLVRQKTHMPTVVFIHLPSLCVCICSCQTQNGLAAFVWWTLINALLGLGVIFKYRNGVPDPLVSTAVLVLITISIIIW